MTTYDVCNIKNKNSSRLSLMWGGGVAPDIVQSYSGSFGFPISKV